MVASGTSRSLSSTRNEMKPYKKRQIRLSKSKSEKANKRKRDLITKTENAKRKIKKTPSKDKEKPLPTSTEPRASSEGDVIKKRKIRKKKKQAFSKKNKYLHLVLAKAGGVNNGGDSVKNEETEKIKHVGGKSDWDANQIDEGVKLGKRGPKRKKASTMGGRKQHDVSTEENMEEIETDKSLQPMKKKRKLASDQSDFVRKTAEKYKLSSGVQSDCEENFTTSVSDVKTAKTKKKLNSNDPAVIKEKAMSLGQRVADKLSGSQFRYINEQLYTSTGKQALDMFTEDSTAYQLYHSGYQSQVAKWPVHPLDIIIEDLKQGSKDLVVADFGCGDARLAASVSNFVYSFDLVALNDRVTVCDMAQVPLKNGSVDVAVFCLSLMGVNFVDYLLEAHRVLKFGGVLKIAEIESRFPDLVKFEKRIQKLGFRLLDKDNSHKMFILFDLKKVKDYNASRIPTLKLNPCLYKKR